MRIQNFHIFTKNSYFFLSKKYYSYTSGYEIILCFWFTFPVNDTGHCFMNLLAIYTSTSSETCLVRILILFNFHLFFKNRFILFERQNDTETRWDREREWDIFHPLAHFPNGCNIWIWANLKLEARCFSGSPMWLQGGAWGLRPFSAAFLCILAGNWIRSRAVWTPIRALMWDSQAAGSGCGKCLPVCIMSPRWGKCQDLLPS